MRYSRLGSSGLEVSRVCLGTMTWGQQNNQQEANQQLDYAVANGVNFIDTAELYSIPPRSETYGATETIIGNWLNNNKERRRDLVLATKIAGPGLSWIRDGSPISGEAVIAAVDASLQRLQTDYIDLYQLHWPNRRHPHFGNHWPGEVKFSDTDSQAASGQMLEILQALKQCVDAGKIRYCGLSDDTTWGISEYLKLSTRYSLPRMVSIQNEFNLLHTKDWPYLIEQCIHEDIAYLPWSPLGGGVLSGKYLNGARPEGSRWTIAQRNGLFRDSVVVEQAVTEIKSLAEQHGLTAAQLALAWCDQVDGVTATIIGATSMAQLQENLNAFDVSLSDELHSEVVNLLKRYPLPF
ncbi:aldo/keto reductase [Planctobacterium marinum]|uniref:aldo/keto reductase n=1 Tax=Planctobacterium marinum TaxID=1631968 RepID=UPI001E4E2CC9|nr:aldo/keto reductase [Planctobacterium marinum]MCC2606389.1 aldo/keto reductase [Planctobacterium marinum]